uniref:Flp pilus assembly protein RcpC/CpaB domain-containing protein n=1 Tax=Streptomyces sp. NBC_01401 TaxID=2903854 RepID=A0AAU3GZR4_9ACTN
MFPSVPDTRPASPSPASPSPVSPALPAPCGVPPFGPLRVRGGGGRRLRRVLRGQRRALAAGFALASAVLAASGAVGERGAAAVAGSAPPGPDRPAVQLVSAPVRIADAATVGLLRPGDRVDVIAAGDGGAGAEVVARDVRVAEVPRGAPGVPRGAGDGSRVSADGSRGAGAGEAPFPRADGEAPADGEASFLAADGGAGMGQGALVVLSVERNTAAALAGAGASGQLAVAVSHAE